MSAIIYRLYYVNTRNEISHITASCFNQIKQGFNQTRKGDYIIPIYMTIEDEDERTYYIPQDELFEELSLKPSSKLKFLDIMVENELLSPELDNALHLDGIYMGVLDSTERSILHNVGIYFYKSAINHQYIVRL